MKRFSEETERILAIFQEFSAIPRGSGNMAGISEYLVRFGENLGLSVLRDERQNVIIKKEGSVGRESQPPLILQCHMDMVCAKTEGATRDPEKDGVSFVREEDRIFSQETTLGADNGEAMAIMLWILEQKNLSHPPLECLFTTDEETGMDGAWGLDLSLLSGKRMVNLDGEEENAVTVSCAGGRDVEWCLPVQREKGEGSAFCVSLSGLPGGHSGVEIHEGRPNGIFMLRQILSYQKGKVMAFAGGEKHNVIPAQAKAFLMFDRETRKEELEALLQKRAKEIDPNARLSVAALPNGIASVLTKESEEMLFSALEKAPHGVVRQDEKGVVTSLNFAKIWEDKKGLHLHFLLRSNRKEEMDALEKTLEEGALSLGGESYSQGDYPPWEEREDSPLRRLFVSLYEEETGSRPRVLSIHAGLECAVFAERFSELDCISVGPDIKGIHAPGECFSIPSLERFTRRLVTLLSRA